MSARPLNLQLVIDILTYVSEYGKPVLWRHLNPKADEKGRTKIDYHFEALGDLQVVQLDTGSNEKVGAMFIKALKPLGEQLVKLFKNKEVMPQIMSQFGEEINGNQLTRILSVGSQIQGNSVKSQPEKKANSGKGRKVPYSITVKQGRELLVRYAQSQIPKSLVGFIRVGTNVPVTDEINITTGHSRAVKTILEAMGKKQASMRIDRNRNFKGIRNLDLFVQDWKPDNLLHLHLGGLTEEEYLETQMKDIKNNVSVALSDNQSTIAHLINKYFEDSTQELQAYKDEKEAKNLNISSDSLKARKIILQAEEESSAYKEQISPLQSVKSEPLDESFFEEDLKEVQKAQEGFLNELKGQSERQEFAEQLGTEEPDLPPVPPEIIANPLQRVPLTSDSAHKGKDLLGFEQDVEAFAAIMALEKLTPPLAIALFGQWGTGKSFFMQKLSEKVEELAKYQGFLKKEDEEDEEGETGALETDEKPFCEGVCQIHFNAWSYMDTNLWASLVTRIFEKLDDYINDNRSEAQKEKDTIKSGIAQQLDVAKGQIAELEARKAQVQNAIDTLTEQVGTAQEELEGKIEEIRSKSRKKAITDAIEESEIRDKLKEMLDKAGITQEKLDQVNPDLILKELKSGQTFIRQFLNYSGWDWALVGVGVALLLITTLVLPKIPDINTGWLNGIGSGLAVLTGILSKVRGTASKLSPLVNGVLKIKSDYDTAVSEAIAKHEQEILAKQIEADQKEVELNQLNLQLKAKEAEIKEMAYKPDSVLAQKAMYNFITRKAASNDYSRHLGIISMIRKDFQTLSELFVESTKAKKVPKKREEKYKEFKEIRDGFDKPLQRIILYIDDLDRCPEERVVEVLEAVNLLMAFPLFVVVVGVDPRWVKNALIKKYHLQFTGHMKGSQQEVDSLGMEVINPSDYLEKIFQIPFHLRAPEDQSIKDMITHLLGDAVAEQPKLEERAEQPETVAESELPNIDLDAFFDKKSREVRGVGEETAEDDELAEEVSKSLSPDELDIDIPAMAPPAEAMEATEEAGEAEQSEEVTEELSGDEADTDEAVEDEVPEGLKVVTPASLTLHWEEGEYMRNLSWLIGNTPRTVKRFVNMYRIIRAHEGLSYENDQNKNDLMIVMFILALRTGDYREVSNRVLHNISIPHEGMSVEDWINVEIEHHDLKIEKELDKMTFEDDQAKMREYESRSGKFRETKYGEIVNEIAFNESLNELRATPAKVLIKYIDFIKRFSFKIPQ